MAYETTAKAIRNRGGVIVNVGNGGAQTLLHNHDRRAWNSGVYGWNFDVYEVYGITICTGYRNIPGRCFFDLLKEYEDAAQKVIRDFDIPYEERVERVENLLVSFCEVVKSEWKEA